MSTAGVALNFRADASPLARHMAALVANGGLEGVKREIGEYLVGEVQDNLDGQTQFDGSPLLQSAAAIGRSGKTLIDDHHLYDSYVYQLTQSGVDVGSNSIYSRIHHFGGTTGRGHAVELPARPVLGIGPEQEDAIARTILSFVDGLAPGGAA